jgi:hypothetical protein
VKSFPIACVLAVASAMLPSCSVDSAPEGLARTKPGDGPTVVFDLTHRPLPDIPVPNDIATFADPSSRTGRRLNVSMIAPTHMERSAREGFSEMEGWGTFAPIALKLAHGRGKNADSHEPAIDLDAVRARMQGDDHDMADDPVYVVNLTTGVPVLIDLGGGSFPTTLRDRDRYYPNDPHAGESNVLFDMHEEGAGGTQHDYRPELDTDFDGVLDHPNILPSGNDGSGAGALAPGFLRGVDDVMTWYERETDTLILRPLLPLEEKTEYAVVVTDRLKSRAGDPVRSPFPFIHHPAQRDAIAKVRSVLADASRRGYYGDVAGTGLDHVAFAWSFTTQPVYEDLRLLRDGLHGQGPFADLSRDFPATATAFRAVGLARDPSDEPADALADPRCAGVKNTPFIVHPKDAQEAIHILLGRFLPFSGETATALEATLDDIDYFVIGSLDSPYFLGDPKHELPDDHFKLDFKTGRGDIRKDTGHFWLAVPKARRGFAQPFSTVLWSHGTTFNAVEIVLRAGHFAKQGLALFGIDMPGHGMVLDKGLELLAQSLLRNTCMVPWVNALTAGRAEDLNGDGVADSGGLLWTAHIFHSRDNIRQSVVDQMQAARVLRAFGSPGTQDYDGNGKPDLLGDFDGNGTPDVGGPAPITASGDSYGGVVTQVLGALDPNVVAAAPISGAGSLLDVASRSFGVVDSVLEQVLTPIVVAIPASTRAPVDGKPQTKCASSDRSVRMIVNDLIGSKEIEIACLSPEELAPDRTVVLTNVTANERRCTRTGVDGRFRVPVPASIDDVLDVQIYDAKDAVDSYATCIARKDAPIGRRIRTWEQPATSFTPVGGEAPPCESDAGCTQFRDRLFGVGDPLTAPQEGLGLARQTPELRQLLMLTQAVMDLGDPVNFAPYYALRPIPGIGAGAPPLAPRPVLTSYTVGDGFVSIAGGYAFARAAGILPFLPPDAATRLPEYAAYATPRALYDTFGGRTPERVLIDAFAMEGIARLERAPAGPRCAANYVPSPTCTGSSKVSASTCKQTLFDVDWLAEGADLYDQQHLPVPLRLVRLAASQGDDPAALERTWAPRLTALPFANDDAGWVPGPPLSAMMSAYIAPLGEHVWTTGEPCKAFDDATYYDHIVARFLASRGTDVYFASHPRTHDCLAAQSCEFLK